MEGENGAHDRYVYQETQQESVVNAFHGSRHLSGGENLDRTACGAQLSLPCVEALTASLDVQIEKSDPHIVEMTLLAPLLKEDTEEKAIRLFDEERSNDVVGIHYVTSPFAYYYRRG